MEVHLTLVAVEGDHGQSLSIACGIDAGYVAVAVHRDVHSAGYAVFDVKSHHADRSVALAGHGIFIGVLAGIDGVLIKCGLGATIHLNVPKGHFALVVTHPGEHL